MKVLLRYGAMSLKGLKARPYKCGYAEIVKMLEQSSKPLSHRGKVGLARDFAFLAARLRLQCQKVKVWLTAVRHSKMSTSLCAWASMMGSAR
jgi:hypothetical protein